MVRPDRFGVCQRRRNGALHTIHTSLRISWHTSPIHTKPLLWQNWHAYASEHSEQIEEAWQRKTELEISVGLTSYSIGQWQGSYGSQRNSTTGCVRNVRRGRFALMASTPAAYADDSCALCTELFADTPQWPIRRTSCNHAFHWTCARDEPALPFATTGARI